MADVKKRPNPPNVPKPKDDVALDDVVGEMVREIREEARNLKIKVGGEEYPIPDLTLRQYRQASKILEDIQERADKENVPESEQLEAGIDYYWHILSPYYEIDRETLEDMPVFQLGREFMTRLNARLFQIPKVLEREASK